MQLSEPPSLNLNQRQLNGPFVALRSCAVAVVVAVVVVVVVVAAAEVAEVAAALAQSAAAAFRLQCQRAPAPPRHRAATPQVPAL